MNLTAITSPRFNLREAARLYGISCKLFAKGAPKPEIRSAQDAAVMFGYLNITRDDVAQVAGYRAPVPRGYELMLDLLDAAFVRIDWDKKQSEWRQVEYKERIARAKPVGRGWVIVDDRKITLEPGPNFDDLGAGFLCNDEWRNQVVTDYFETVNFYDRAPVATRTGCEAIWEGTSCCPSLADPCPACVQVLRDTNLDKYRFPENNYDYDC